MGSFPIVFNHSTLVNNWDALENNATMSNTPKNKLIWKTETRIYILYYTLHNWTT